MEFPHHYTVHASAEPAGDVTLASPGLVDLPSAPPPQFGGPGDRWSAETMLVAAAADCFALGFRVSAEMSKLAWTRLECSAEGELDRVERALRFTGLRLRARLVVPEGTDVHRAKRLLERAEKSCLVTNSLDLSPELDCEVVVEP